MIHRTHTVQRQIFVWLNFCSKKCKRNKHLFWTVGNWVKLWKIDQQKYSATQYSVLFHLEKVYNMLIYKGLSSIPVCTGDVNEWLKYDFGKAIQIWAIQINHSFEGSLRHQWAVKVFEMQFWLLGDLSNKVYCLFFGKSMWVMFYFTDQT